MNDVLARAARDFEDDAPCRQDITKDTENEIAIAQCCRGILASVVHHHPQAFPELGSQNSRLGKSRRNRRMSAHWCCQRPRVSASQLLRCSASCRRMYEPCRVAQSLPTPDTIMLRTARCSACCDRRGDQGGDRSRPHAAARGGIERIRPNIFDGGNAEGVDRRLGDDEARKSRPLWRQTEQRFRAARQRALVGGSAYVDMRDSSRVIAIRVPGAPWPGDDQDPALAATVFEAELRALLSVELPRRRRSLQDDGAMLLRA